MRTLSFGIATVTLLSLTITVQADDAKSLVGSKPNILLIMTDDQGYGDLGAHGNPVIKTPNLDDLHKRSLRLHNFHVSPTCSPTRAALMTGRHPMKGGVTHTILERERLDLNETILPQYLKEAGYTTGIFGKWHLGDETPYQPYNRGFDEVYIHGCGGIGQAYPGGSGGDAPNNSYFNPAIWHNDKFEKTKGYCTDLFFEQAAKWIGNVQGKQPFFAYIATNTPHNPLTTPDYYTQLYPNQQEDVAKYLGMETNIDDNVGRILAKLDTLGLTDNTLVIFLNDNGGVQGTRVFNAGMRGNKGTVYLGGTRAMCFWHWPGKIEPRTVDAASRHFDIPVTLLEIAGVKTDAKFDGRSLVPVLEGKNVDWSERIFVIHSGRWPLGEVENNKYNNVALRQGEWSMVSAINRQKKDRKQRTEPRWELYNLQNDFGETTNVAKQHPEIVQRLSDYYDQWWKDVRPEMTNEDAYKTAPKQMPFHRRYYKQFPDERK